MEGLQEPLLIIQEPMQLVNILVLEVQINQYILMLME
jgi:hypothetical protein